MEENVKKAAHEAMQKVDFYNYPEELFQAGAEWEAERGKWIEIKSVDDLPKVKLYCWFWDLNTNKAISGIFLNDKESIDFILANASHYLVMNEPTPPKTSKQ